METLWGTDAQQARNQIADGLNFKFGNRELDYQFWYY
jgi:hypothetical protein